MTIKAPFNPSYGAGQVTTLGGTPSTINLATKNKQVMFLNLGPQTAYVRMAPGPIVGASQADAILPVNLPVIYTKFEDIQAISLVSTGASTVHIMPGEGLTGI